MMSCHVTIFVARRRFCSPRRPMFASKTMVRRTPPEPPQGPHGACQRACGRPLPPLRHRRPRRRPRRRPSHRIARASDKGAGTADGRHANDAPLVAAATIGAHPRVTCSFAALIAAANLVEAPTYAVVPRALASAGSTAQFAVRPGFEPRARRVPAEGELPVLADRRHHAGAPHLRRHRHPLPRASPRLLLLLLLQADAHALSAVVRACLRCDLPFARRSCRGG